MFKTIILRLVATAVILMFAAVFGEYAWIPIVAAVGIWFFWPAKKE